MNRPHFYKEPSSHVGWMRGTHSYTIIPSLPLLWWLTVWEIVCIWRALSIETSSSFIIWTPTSTKLCISRGLESFKGRLGWGIAWGVRCIHCEPQNINRVQFWEVIAFQQLCGAWWAIAFRKALQKLRKTNSSFSSFEISVCFFGWFLEMTSCVMVNLTHMGGCSSVPNCIRK